MDFDALYRACFREVYLYIRSLCGNGDVAEEIAQEAFMKALKSIDRFDGVENIRAWLFAIARNTFYSWRRRQKFCAGVEPPDGPAPGRSLAERLGDEESADRIHTILHDMKEPYKEVFSLRVFGELGFEKIGGLFGRSAGWARVTFYRAKMQIIDHMEETDNAENQL